MIPFNLTRQAKMRTGGVQVFHGLPSVPWGGARGSLTAHSPLQSATLLSQHYHYLRWPNLHVRRSVTCSTVVSTVNLLDKVQYIINRSLLIYKIL